MALVAAVYVVGRSFTRKRGELLLVAVAVVDAGVSLLSGHDGPLTRLLAARASLQNRTLTAILTVTAVNKSNTVTTILYRYSCEC